MEELSFNKSDEQVLNDFENYFEDLVTCFNEFTRPEFSKIISLPLKKYEQDRQEIAASRRTQIEHDRGRRRRTSNQPSF